MALYKGFWMLAARDIPGWASYFYMYEYLKDSFGLKNDHTGTETWLQIFTRVWCGGVAGQISWIVSYPQDVVKTHMQCTQETTVSAREVIVRGYREGGVYFFFKGLQPTLLRGFITNAVALSAFDYMNMRYKRNKNSD